MRKLAHHQPHPPSTAKRWPSACRRPPISLREARVPLLRSDPRASVGLWPTTTALPLARSHPRPPIPSRPLAHHAFLAFPHPRQHQPPDLSRAVSPRVQVARPVPRQIPSIPCLVGRTTFCMPTMPSRGQRQPVNRTLITTRLETRKPGKPRNGGRNLVVAAVNMERGERGAKISSSEQKRWDDGIYETRDSHLIDGTGARCV